ncbi:DUF1642 domain-containing protein [Streptococcus sp. HMSC078D09]|uniref:DUF1642 domain-containing protein n=1 Tax=Streptococcus sp. HMSC078D09 TaxID=1739430 RepID=UPI0008BA1CF8|nr:DUF1642 domain-containing protein [Streptococcus sp. HMSC078D09]OFQ66144.1 hypothetical protein HMPREF2926_04850 [Streptococcus sp. HMSC078D09]
MNKDKVYLGGYVVGYSADTLGHKGLQIQLENMDIVEIDENLVHKKIDEPQLIKLKNVIARIKDFDSGTQIVWLDAILNELGSDYGILKYKTGYEQGRFEGEYVGQQLKDADKVRQELNKPVVKQFVADWYEEHKEGLEFNIWDWIKYTQEEEKIKNRQFTEWLAECENDPVETLIKMKLFGYEIEKEKRYIVKVKGADEGYNYLNCHISSECWFFSGESEPLDFRVKHTRKELEKASFGWIFDCKGIEVKEVKE